VVFQPEISIRNADVEQCLLVDKLIKPPLRPIEEFEGLNRGLNQSRRCLCNGTPPQAPMLHVTSAGPKFPEASMISVSTYFSTTSASVSKVVPRIPIPQKTLPSQWRTLLKPKATSCLLRRSLKSPCSFTSLAKQIYSANNRPVRSSQKLSSSTPPTTFSTLTAPAHMLR
jgi:hypothetical protein